MTTRIGTKVAITPFVTIQSRRTERGAGARSAGSSSESPFKETSADMKAFELSRIYGQGWNTAKKLQASGKWDVDAPQAAARNPHRGAEERSRWTRGFMEAVERQAGRSTTPGAHSWRASFAKRISAGEAA